MSAASPVVIANMALGNIGARDTIESFDEQSIEARTAKFWYPKSRQSVLEAYDWSFARVRVALSLDEEDPPDDWYFRYGLPADCLKARRITNNMQSPGWADWPTAWTVDPDSTPFSIELNADKTRRTLLTNMEAAVLMYTCDMIDTSLFTSMFVDALTYKLASDMAMRITGKASVREQNYKQYVFAVRDAAANDANEDQQKKPRDAEWIRGR